MPSDIQSSYSRRYLSTKLLLHTSIEISSLWLHALSSFANRHGKSGQLYIIIYSNTIVHQHGPFRNALAFLTASLLHANWQVYIRLSSPSGTFSPSLRKHFSILFLQSFRHREQYHVLFNSFFSHCYFSIVTEFTQHRALPTFLFSKQMYFTPVTYLSTLLCNKSLRIAIRSDSWYIVWNYEMQTEQCRRFIPVFWRDFPLTMIDYHTMLYSFDSNDFELNSCTANGNKDGAKTTISTTFLFALYSTN